MKTVTYKDIFNEDIEVEYDENAPCRICGLPVEHASMGGTDVCPYCDYGRYRDGTEITFIEMVYKNNKLRKKAKDIYEKLEEKKEKYIKEPLINFL